MDLVQNVDETTSILVEDGEITDNSPPPSCDPKPPEPTIVEEENHIKSSKQMKGDTLEPLTIDLVDEPASMPATVENRPIEIATAPAAVMAPEPEEDDKDSRTLFVGNIGEKVTEELLYELMLQAGPIEEINIPKDKETKKQKSFGFILFKYKCAVEYACKIFEGTRLFGRELRLKNRNRESASGGSGGGLEVLAHGFHMAQSRANNLHQNDLHSSMMLANNPAMMNHMIAQNPSMLMNMMPQMLQNLNNINPFATQFGQYPSQNQINGNDRNNRRSGGSGGPDRSHDSWVHNRGGRSYHDNKPYDRDRGGWERDRNRDRRRSRSRDNNYRRNRSRSRSRDRNRYRGRR